MMKPKTSLGQSATLSANSILPRAGMPAKRGDQESEALITDKIASAVLPFKHDRKDTDFFHKYR